MPEPIRPKLATLAPPSSPRQVVLGLFILFQLAFLVVSNLLGALKYGASEVKDKPKELINRLVPRFADEEGHTWKWTEEFETIFRRYTQLTGQEQEWSLFAPSVGKATGFPAVLMISDDATSDGPSIREMTLKFDAVQGFNWWSAQTPPNIEMLLSENEPPDINDYLRFGKCRVRRYEGQLYFNPEPYEAESAKDLAERLNRRVHRLLGDYHDPALEYLKWRLKAWQRAHPDKAPPKQLILIERFYRIHPPKKEEDNRGWDGPLQIPVARWLTDGPRNENQYVLEPFDFAEQRFVPMNR